MSTIDLKAKLPIAGTDGDDVIAGSAKDDVIFGGAGADTITGGEGKDVIFTGSGADTVVFAAGSGKDVVADFTLGIDRLQLDGITIADITEIDTDKDGTVDSTVVTFDSKDSVQLVGVTGADAQALLAPELLVVV